VDDDSPVLRLTSQEILKFDPDNAAIPSCTERDWNIAMSIWKGHAQRMAAVATLSEGEVHAQAHREHISPRNDGPVILRGANITLYAVRDASQGEELRLDTDAYLEGKLKGGRAYAYKHRRVGFQRSAPQNNFRRLIAAIVEPGAFCFDTVKFVPEGASKIDLDLLLGLLNSKLLDWYFRIASTNSKVNEYQFDNLPVPNISNGTGIEWKSLLKRDRWEELTRVLSEQCTSSGQMPAPVAETLAEMSRRIQKIEAKRVLKNRSERSRLAPESQPIQDAIDAVLFRCYGLSEDDAKYIEKRLEEML
jgi:hypothetical protein